jgi:hypothetical protein
MTHTEIIKRHGDKAIAAAAGANERRVRAWRERNSIPARYWPALVAAKVAKLNELAAGVTKRTA